MVLSKANMKTNFLSIFFFVCQSINWYANAILSLVVKIGRNLKSIQKILKNLLPNTTGNLLQMSLNWKFHEICQTWQKSKTRKTKISEQVPKKKHCLWKIQTSFSGICILSWKKMLHEKRSAKRKWFSGELCIFFYGKRLWKIIITLQELDIKKEPSSVKAN